MKRTIYSGLTRHTLFVSSINKDELPKGLEYTESYKTFYKVQNWDASGVVFMYLGKGHEQAPKQIVAWYRNTGSMWSSFGLTLQEAIEGAQRDGWLSA